MSESDKNVLNNLVRRLGKALEDTCNRLVFIDGKPYVHPGDTATAESILTLVGLCPTSYRVHIENPCEPEEPCELTCERVIKNGFRFQPIARDGNLGRDDPGPGIPPPLARQVRDLEAEGLGARGHTRVAHIQHRDFAGWTGQAFDHLHRLRTDGAAGTEYFDLSLGRHFTSPSWLNF